MNRAPDFDVTVHGEPYIALMLLYHTKSGQYFSRLWNRTLDSGAASTLEDLSSVCEAHFLQRGALCLGCPESEEEVAGHAFFVSQSPFPRRISRECTGFMDSEISTTCSECANLNSEGENDIQAEEGEAVDEAVEDEELAPLSPYMEDGNGQMAQPQDDLQSQEGEIDPSLYQGWQGPDAQSGSYKRGDVLCKHCGKDFKNKRSLYSHMSDKHSSDPKVHLCPNCGASFGRKSNMRAHMRVNCKVGKMGQVTDPVSASTSVSVSASAVKPPWTRIQLTMEALRSAENATLRHPEICRYISEKYPYFKLEDKEWQHGIRKVLKWNKQLFQMSGMVEGRQTWTIANTTMEHNPETHMMEPSVPNNTSDEPYFIQDQQSNLPTEENLEQGAEEYASQNVAIKVEPGTNEEEKAVMREALEYSATQAASMVKIEYEDQDQNLEEGEASTSQGQPANNHDICRYISETAYSQPDGTGKPPFTYAQLITQALMTEKDSGLLLSDIYSFINQKYPYYRMENPAWQNAIRHNLTLNPGFEKVPATVGSNKGGRRGNWWRLKPGYDFTKIIKKRLSRKSTAKPVPYGTAPHL